MSDGSAAARVVDLFMQSWIASAVLAAANLGIADHVGDEPIELDEVARHLGVDRRSLFRLMRGLASAGVFRETGEGRFAHTPMSAALRTGAAGNARASIRLFGLRSFREALAQYEHAITTGRPAFEVVHQTGSFYDLLASRPEEARLYHEGMSVEGAAVDKIVELVDFSGLDKVVDVGGGRGTLLASILAQHPWQHGVLFDLPSVVAEAPPVLAAAGVGERCQIVGGDMEKEVPRGGDGYLLKYILHSRPDAQCAYLLRRIGEAASPSARVFIIENVMPEGNDPAACKLFDLFLLLGGDNGRVRTRAELGRLLERVGFEIASVTPVLGDLHVVEARRRAKMG